MSHSMMIAANPMSNLLPLQSLTGGAASKLKAADTGTGSGTGSNTSSSSTDSIGTTFLSLLVQELQNQDPTAPMDSTQMVGQMISLNQLNQLTSINQTLSHAYPTASGSSATTGNGASGGGGTGSGATGHVAINPAVAAAMQMLANSSVRKQPAVSPSVSLPAF